MLEKRFKDVYNVFRKNLYESICKGDSNLTVDEVMSLEIIHMLGTPTILEYASYLGISQPNATYKINQLIKKGYLSKQTSLKDKRVTHLNVTEEFLHLYRKNDQYIKEVMDMIKEDFSEEKVIVLEEMLESIALKMNKEEGIK